VVTGSNLVFADTSGGNCSGDYSVTVTTPLPETLAAQGGQKVIDLEVAVLPQARPQRVVVDGQVWGVVGGNDIFDGTARTIDSWTVTRPASAEYVGGSSSPDRVTRGQLVAFTSQIRNTGGTTLLLPADSSRLQFGDGVTAHQFTAFLQTEHTIAAAGLETLRFVGTVVDSQMAPGRYTPSFILRGQDSNGMPYSDTLFIDPGELAVQAPASISYLGGTLAPDRVTRGHEIAFQVTVSNRGGAGVILDPEQTAIAISDSSLWFSSPLVEGAAIDSGATEPLVFASALLSSSLRPGTYTPMLYLSGIDANGFAFAETVAAGMGELEVQAPPEVRYAEGSLHPTILSLGSEFSLTVEVRNLGQAGVTLLADSTTFSFSDGLGHTFRAPLDSSALVPAPPPPLAARRKSQPVGDEAHPPSLNGLLHFRAARVDSSMALGRYKGEFVFKGIDTNGSPYSSSDTTGPQDIQVVPGTVLTGAFLAAAAVDRGQEFEIRLRVANAGSQRVLRVAPSAPQGSGSADAELLSGPTPPFQDVLPDSAAIFGWRYRASTARSGNLRFTVGAAGTDSLFGVPVSMPPVTSGEYLIQVPAALTCEFEIPPFAVRGENMLVELRVRNEGEGAARGVRPESLRINRPELAELISAPSDTGASLPGGAETQFLWEYRVGGAVGDVLLFTTRTEGTAVNSGSPLLSGYSTSDSLRIISRLATSLVATGGSTAPTSVARGQRGVGMLDLRLLAAGDTATHAVTVNSLTVTFSDRQGNPLIPGRVLSRVFLVDSAGGVLSERNGLGTSGNTVVLAFPDSTFLLRGGSPRRLSLVVDVAADAQGENFRVLVADSNSLLARDAAVGSVVRILDQYGQSLSGIASECAVILGSDLSHSFTNYPNPFAAGKERTNITYYLPGQSSVTVNIFTLLGELVWSVSYGQDSPEGKEGLHDHGQAGCPPIEWDGRNGEGAIVLNGIYLCRIETNAGTAIRKIAVAK
jgi:hypothetical protein